MSKTTEEVMQTFKKESKKSYSPSISLDKAFRDAGFNRPTSKDYNDFYDFWKQSGLRQLRLMLFILKLQPTNKS